MYLFLSSSLYLYNSLREVPLSFKYFKPFKSTAYDNYGFNWMALS